MIGWKKVLRPGYLNAPSDRRLGYIVKLDIPDNADVCVHAGFWGPRVMTAAVAKKLPIRGKCRASLAKVVSIGPVRQKSKLGGRMRDRVGVAAHDRSFLYFVGGQVVPKELFDKAPIVCSSGIHFFTTRKAAEEWNL